MTKKEALQNAIQEVQNLEPVVITPFTFEYKTKEEKNEAHAQTMLRMFTAMAEGNKKIIESGEACI